MHLAQQVFSGKFQLMLGTRRELWQAVDALIPRADINTTGWTCPDSEPDSHQTQSKSTRREEKKEERLNQVVSALLLVSSLGIFLSLVYLSQVSI